MPGIFSGSGGSSQSSSYNSNSTTNVNYPSWYENFAKKIVDKSSGLLDNPYPTYDTSKVFAGFQPTQQQAFNQVGNNQTSWQPYFNSATGTLNQTMPQALGYFNQAGAQPTALQAAAPFMGAASATWNTPGVAQSYMNPYIAGSVNYANQLATDNFLQNVLPGVTSQFVGGGERGGLGTPQYGKSMDWALKNFNNALLGNTQNAMANGYFQSGNLFNTDQARLAGLGSTAGGLATQGTGALTNLGQAVSGSGVTNAGAFGTLGNYFSNNNLTNTNALLQVGNQQQQQAQNPLTFDYQQFLNQQNWPYQLASWATGIEGGLRVPSTQTTNSSGTQNTYGTSNSSPSPFGTAMGILSGVGSMFTGGIPGMMSSLGGMFGGGGAAAGAGGAFIPTPATGYFSEGGYLGIDAPSKPIYYDTKRLARGGFLGIDRSSTPSSVNTTYVRSPRGGYLSDLTPKKFATGGLATVVRAGRKETRNDIRAAEAASRNPMFASRDVRTKKQPLSIKRSGFLGGDRSPVAARRAAGSPHPGYFGNV